MKFKESALAHKFLDGLTGIEIGGAAHNPFGIAHCLNVDYTDDITTIFKKHEVELCGEYLKVDLVASGDNLPFKDDSLDFVVSSHVIEHFTNPLAALREWMRVVKPGGYIFTICPHKERTFDKDRPRTTLQELIDRDKSGIIGPDIHGHCTVWITEDMYEVCKYLSYRVVAFQDVDDKVGNGFTVVLQK